MDAREHDPVEDTRMTLGEHLDELRIRLIRSTVVLVVAFSTLYAFRVEVVHFIQKPYVECAQRLNGELIPIRRAQVERDFCADLALWSSSQAFRALPSVGRPLPSGPAPAPDWSAYFRTPKMDRLVFGEEMDPDPTSFKAGGPFFVKLKACFWLSLLIGGPFFLWEIWMFIAAGLYKAEKKVVYTYFPASLVLFVLGVSFGYVSLVPMALYALQGQDLGLDSINRTMELDQYMQFLKGLALALGLVFQLPIFQFALSRMGIVRPETYAKLRGHMVVVTLIVAAILTPPDPVTQVMLAGPAVLLWEIGYWIARLSWKEPESADLDLPDGGVAT